MTIYLYFYPMGLSQPIVKPAALCHTVLTSHVEAEAEKLARSSRTAATVVGIGGKCPPGVQAVLDVNALSQLG